MNYRKPSGRFYKDQGDESFMQGKYRAAITSFDCALVLDSGDGYSLRKLAECYTKLGDLDSAVRCWEQLGEKLMREGRHRQAIAAFKMAQKINPDDPLTQGIIDFVQAAISQKPVIS